MFRARPLFSLALLSALGVAVQAAAPRVAQKQHTRNAFHGVVVAVHHGKKGSPGRIVVRHHDHKTQRDGDRIDRNVTKTFRVNARTTFEVVHPGNSRATRGTNLSHIQKGQHVVIRHHDHLATDVRVVRHANPGKK